MGFVPPHRIDAEHDDVTIPEFAVDNSRSPSQFFAVRQTAADQEIVHFLGKTEDCFCLGLLPPEHSGRLGFCLTGLLEFLDGLLAHVSRPSLDNIRIIRTAAAAHSAPGASPHHHVEPAVEDAAGSKNRRTAEIDTQLIAVAVGDRAFFLHDLRFEDASPRPQVFCGSDRNSLGQTEMDRQ